ncbi:uncharacterized protein LOC130623977 isoform X2 [Hydractinia symbiolongicarpus]|uniref:uncharacterized protein LOC130623977 isoform X2 n=1 Tax=Hydractinia symbiolongicarpus TaxID=13093 RepID=UPI00254F44E7|nr:uncharacterized protein LOC130623977 isoform X2 [Hydractinia symbiolongicarpus]
MFFLRQTDPIFAENEYSIRLGTLLNHGGTKILRSIFHNKTIYNGKSEDPDVLFQEMKKHKNSLKKELRIDQMELVFPKSQKTISAKFDISILVILIAICVVVPPPSSTGNWKDKPDKNDTSIGAYVIRLRFLRNEVIHSTTINIDQKFSEKWKEIIDVLKNLGFDVKTVTNLKSSKFCQLELYKLSMLHANVDLLEGKVNQWIKQVDKTSRNIDNLDQSQVRLEGDIQFVISCISNLSNHIIGLENSQTSQDQNLECVRNTLENVLSQTRRHDELFEQANHVIGMLSRNIHTYIDDEIKAAFDRTTIQYKPLEERLKQASLCLKQKVRSKHERQCLRNPFGPTSVKKPFFVDLVTVKDDGLNLFCNGQQHHKDVHSARTETVGIEQIFYNDQKYAILRGAAGVGKSYFIQNAVYLWSKGELWNQFKFVLHFQCREMNCYNNISSFETLLQKSYPELLNIITFVEFLKVSDTFLICIDGMDEFIGISDFSQLAAGKSCHTFPITQCIYSTLSFMDNTLSQSHILLSGRPNVCIVLQRLFDKFGINTIDILGFSDANVCRYVSSYFASSKARAEELKRVLVENTNINLMTRIPVYLWVICSLYDQANTIIQTPETITELYILELLLFMKKHYHGESNMTEIKWAQIIENDEIIQAVLELAKISYQMMSKNIKFFEEEEISTLVKASGMVTEIDTTLGKKYQFFHASMQEFLAAIYAVCRNFKLEDLYNIPLWPVSDKVFRGVLPIAFGLTDAESKANDSESIAGIFMKNLRKKLPGQSGLDINKFLRRVLKTAGSECWARDCDEFELFLNCYFEYQQKLRDDDWCKNILRQGGFQLQLKIKLPRQLKQALYFLQNDRKYVSNIKLTLFSTNHTFCDDMKKKLAAYLLDVKRLETDDVTLANFAPPEVKMAQTNRKYKLELIDLFLTRKSSLFNSRWLIVPAKLIIRSGVAVELLLDTIKEWNMKGAHLNSVEIYLLVAQNDTIGHILALLEMFHYVPNIGITMSQLSEASLLQGFYNCGNFVRRLDVCFKAPSKLTNLRLNFKSEQHKYSLWDGRVWCNEINKYSLWDGRVWCNEYDNPLRGDSINSSMNDIDVITSDDDPHPLPSNPRELISARCCVVFGLIGLLLALIGLVVWLYALDGRSKF